MIVEVELTDQNDSGRPVTRGCLGPDAPVRRNQKPLLDSPRKTPTPRLRDVFPPALDNHHSLVGGKYPNWNAFCPDWRASAARGLALLCSAVSAPTLPNSHKYEKASKAGNSAPLHPKPKPPALLRACTPESEGDRGESADASSGKVRATPRPFRAWSL